MLEEILNAIKQLLAELLSSHGEWKNAVIAINGTTSGEVDLGRHYHLLEIQIPTIDSANITLTTSDQTGGTFQTLGGSSNICAAGTGAFNDTFILGGWQFVKVATSATQTAARTFRMRGIGR